MPLKLLGVNRLICPRQDLLAGLLCNHFSCRLTLCCWAGDFLACDTAVWCSPSFPSLWQRNIGGWSVHRWNRPGGLEVKASASRTEDPGFESRLRRDFSGVESYQWLKKSGTPVATLPGAWRYRVSAGTGWPGVSILWLGETESLVCNFYLSVAARKIVCADPSLRDTRMLLGR